jgi:hypothetical protein
MKTFDIMIVIAWVVGVIVIIHGYITKKIDK